MSSSKKNIIIITAISLLILSIFLFWKTLFCNNVIRLRYYVLLCNVSKKISYPLKRYSLESIGMMGEKRDIRTAKIFRELLRSEDQDLRIEAADALGKLKDKASVKELVYVAKNDESIACYVAMWSLGKIGTPDAINELINIARNHTEDSSRKEAIRSLRRIKIKKVENLLIESIKDPSETVRSEAIDILGERKSRPAMPHIIRSLKDKSSLVRLSAVKALSNINDERAVQPIMELIMKEKKPHIDIKVEAIESFSKFHKRKDVIIPFLEELLNDGEVRVREASKSTIQKLK